MSEQELHVVFGVGQVGRTLAGQLAASGRAVRTVSRNRPATLPAGVDWREADVTDPLAAGHAARDGTVLYQCLNAPYAQWRTHFPPMQRGVLAAAEHTGALLVSLENVYAYGPLDGAPMTEDLPLAATTVKGRTRAEMTAALVDAAAAGRIRMAIGRAADFFGPGVGGSALGDRVFGNALAGKKVDFLGNPELLHSYSYVPDVAAGLATLGTDPQAVGEVWHLPGPETTTTRAVLDLVAAAVGHPVVVRSLPKPALRVAGLFSPTIRALAEMEYQFEEPYVLDTTKYETAFGRGGTPMATAIADTVAAWTPPPGGLGLRK